MVCRSRVQPFFSGKVDQTRESGGNRAYDKPEEEDPREEEQALVSDMLEYRDNLCRHLFNLLSKLAAQQVDMVRFGPSFKAGWQEWKKRDEQQE